jgi:hypothetical protein
LQEDEQNYLDTIFSSFEEITFSNEELPPRENLELSLFAEDQLQHQAHNTANSSDISELMKAFVKIKVTHKVSGAAANAFWNFAIQNSEQLFRAKHNLPSFKTVSRINDKTLPQVLISFAFLNTTTGNIFCIKRLYKV